MPNVFIDDLYNANAADFDGSSGYLNRGADLSSNADSSQGILSVWARLDGGDGSQLQIIWSTGSTVNIHRSSANKFSINVTNGTGVLAFTSTNTYTSGSSWIHLLASWDTNFGAGSKVSHMYVNGSSDKTGVTDSGIAFNIDYTVANYQVAAQSGSTFFNGCLAEVYFAPGQFLDFSNANNRLKFRSALGKPVFLGMDGSLPTGTAPKIFLRYPASSFEINGGSGGNFTRNGTIVAGSTSPSL